MHIHRDLGKTTFDWSRSNWGALGEFSGSLDELFGVSLLFCLGVQSCCEVERKMKDTTTIKKGMTPTIFLGKTWQNMVETHFFSYRVRCGQSLLLLLLLTSAGHQIERGAKLLSHPKSLELRPRAWSLFGVLKNHLRDK